MPRKKQPPAPTSKPGPKPLLNATVRKAIAAAVGDGLPIKHAADAAGVSERAVYYWLRAGRDGTDPESVQFLQAVKRARAKGIRARLRRITKAARDHWQADAWVLERTHPEHFGSDRREVRELKKQLAYLIDRLARLEGPTDAPGNPPPDANDPPPAGAGGG